MPAANPVGNLLYELAPVGERLLERHLTTAKEWFPHELVPWERGADADPREPWREETFPLPDGVRRALYVNLLTEDNLPYYFTALDDTFGPDHPWGAWSRRWTAEEGRHSIVIRDYLTVSGAVDPVALERGRMQQMTTGFRLDAANPAEGFVYTALQELATRIAHRNTGKLLDDPVGYELMARVAADENLHYLYYRDLVSAGLAFDPSTMMLAIERQVRDFEMPGTGIEGFHQHARAIADAGIYDYVIHHEQILVALVLRHWKVESVEGLTPEAERAREALIDHIDKVGRVARRLAKVPA